jgi:xanthine/uracil/vitamin C permease (AzgA family)
MFAPEGGKTGITAVVTGLMFFVSVFFAPIFASIPSWATGGALVIVGSLMIRKCVHPLIFHAEPQCRVLIDVSFYF